MLYSMFFEILSFRVSELKYFRDMNVYKVVPREHQLKTKGKIIKTRWLDINKGDLGNPEHRSRLVAKEVKRSKQDKMFVRGVD